MNPSGDAAEQVVRMSLEGMEVACRISGVGAKEIGIRLFTALKQEQKTKGKARLGSMIRSGKELKVYTLQQGDLKKFAQEAKRYGVLYCVLKERGNTSPTAQIDVIARADDASKIKRITDRFKLVAVDAAKVESSFIKDKERLMPVRERLEQGRFETPPPKKADGLDWARAITKVVDTRNEQPNPRQALAEKDLPSEAELLRQPRSKPVAREAQVQAKERSREKPEQDRPSVREKLIQYKIASDLAKAERRREMEKALASGKDTLIPKPKVKVKER